MALLMGAVILLRCMCQALCKPFYLALLSSGRTLVCLDFPTLCV